MLKSKTSTFSFIVVLLLVSCSSFLASENESSLDLDTINTELLVAAGNGDVITTQSLLAQGADVHIKDAYGITPLIAAAYKNHIDVAKMLIDSGLWAFPM